MQQATHTQMSWLCFLFATSERPRHVTAAQNQNSKTIKERDHRRTRSALNRVAVTVVNHVLTVSYSVSLKATCTLISETRSLVVSEQ